MDRNRRLATYLDEISSLITVLEILTTSFQFLTSNFPYAISFSLGRKECCLQAAHREARGKVQFLKDIEGEFEKNVGWSQHKEEEINQIYVI